MPLYVADYRADTAHLRTIEHGAYFLLIMHYWATGGLPDDDAQLSRIAGMASSEWRKSKPVLQAFFIDGWKHKRIDAELELADSKYQARAEAGRKGGIARASGKQNPSNASAMFNQPQPPSLAKAKAPDGAPNPEKDLYDRGKIVLGNGSGGLIKRLLLAKQGDTALARAAIETASTKSDPREYIGGVLRGANGSQDSFLDPTAGIL